MKYVFWFFGGITLLWLTSGLLNIGQGEVVVTFGPVVNLPDPNQRDPIFLTKGQGSLRTTLVKRLSTPESVGHAVFQAVPGTILLLGERSAFECNLSSGNFERLPIPTEAKPISADANGNLFLIRDEDRLVKTNRKLQKLWDFKVAKYSQVVLLSNDRTLVWAPWANTTTILDQAGEETRRISYAPSIGHAMVGDKLDTLWMTDSGTHLLSRLSEDGGVSHVITESTEINAEPNELFAYPSHVMADVDNRLWVENYLEREGDSVTIINPTRDRFLRFWSKDFLTELDHENEEYILHVSPLDNTLLVTNIREPEMFLYSYDLEFEKPRGSESGIRRVDQPTPIPKNAGVPQHVVGHWYPSKYSAVPLLGLVLGTAGLVVLWHRGRPKK